MLFATKLPGEHAALLVIPKMVVSVWPLLYEGALLASAYNAAIVVHNLPASPINATGMRIYFPGNFVSNRKVRDISWTLLDPRNPLSYNFSGPYRKRPGAPILDYYDGVEDVAVDLGARHEIFDGDGKDYQYIQITFSHSLPAAAKLGVRLLLQTRRLFFDGGDGSFHFSLPMLSESVAAPILGNSNLARAHGIPVLTIADTSESGGFDIFFYMPLSLRPESFNIDPVIRLLPQYDFMGRSTEAPLWKNSWPAARIHRSGRTVRSLQIGENTGVSGTYSLRERKPDVTINNRSGNVVVGSSISSSSLRAGEASLEELGIVLKQLLEALGDSPLDPETRDIVETHVLETSRAAEGGHPGVLRRTARSLARLGKGLATTSPEAGKVVDLVGKLAALAEKL